MKYEYCAVSNHQLAASLPNLVAAATIMAIQYEMSVNIQRFEAIFVVIRYLV